jgi:glutamine amidotransferase
VPGLGIFEGRMFRLSGDVKVPHVGWNALGGLVRSPLVDGIDEGDAVYFTHSYAAPVSPAAIAQTAHGMPFASIVQRQQVSGMQFHPEKSGRAGIRLLRNWVAQCSASV